MSVPVIVGMVVSPPGTARNAGGEARITSARAEVIRLRS
ncbi:hypothetical protein SNL152K_6975 [Streptomyces sp. NL15-2K]|nr:hypothetical protein SNL152K_6975 [Streptomyces sp. NL15-2K]